MSENRRDALRLTLGQPGELRYGRRKVPCTVVDVSVTGARIKLEASQLVPDRRVLLTTTITGRTISLMGTLRRAEPGAQLALSFDKESSELNRLISDHQRRRVRGGLGDGWRGRS